MSKSDDNAMPMWAWGLVLIIPILFIGIYLSLGKSYKPRQAVSTPDAVQTQQPPVKPQQPMFTHEQTVKRRILAHKRTRTWGPWRDTRAGMESETTIFECEEGVYRKCSYLDGSTSLVEMEFTLRAIADKDFRFRDRNTEDSYKIDDSGSLVCSDNMGVVFKAAPIR